MAGISALGAPLHGLRNLLGHLRHLGKLLGRLGLPKCGGTGAVIPPPVKGLLLDRADHLRPVVALVAGDILFLKAEVDILEHGVTLDHHNVQVPQPLLILRFKETAIGGDALFQDVSGTVLQPGAQVERLGFGEMGLAVILDLFVKHPLHKLAVFHDVALDLPVFGLLGLDPLDGVLQQVKGQRDDVIIGHG